jgi:hypothetical protein
LGLTAKGKFYTHLGRWGLYHRQDLGSVTEQGSPASKGMGFWILIALGILLALFIVLSLVTAADRPDAFDQKSRHANYETIDQGAGRPVLFDRNSRRTGYGVKRSGGSWDLFRPEASRLDVMQPTLGGLPSRLLLQPRKK